MAKKDMPKGNEERWAWWIRSNYKHKKLFEFFNARGLAIVVQQLNHDSHELERDEKRSNLPLFFIFLG